MDPSTGNNVSNKRVRFDATASATPDDDDGPTKTPLATAILFVQNHLVSLQPPIAEILAEAGIEYVRHQSKMISKQRQINRFSSDAELIPRSAKSAFTLRVMKRAETDPDMIQVMADILPIVDQFQKACKAKILLANQIELRILLEESRELFAKALRRATEVFIVADGHPITDTDKIVNTLLDRYHEELLVHLDSTLPAFRDLYQTVNTTTLPQPFIAPRRETTAQPSFADAARAAAAERASDAYDGSMFFQQPQQPPAAAAPVLPLPPPVPSPAEIEISKIRRAIESVFVTSITIYHDVVTKNDIQLQLLKLKTTYSDTESTEATAMALDAETPADRQLLNELIRKESDKSTKKMDLKLAQMQKTISRLTLQKNSQRGRSKPTGASSKKSSNQRAKPKDTKKQNKKPAGRTDGNANASSTAPAANSRNSRKKSPNRNDPNSSRKKTRPKRSTSRSRPRSDS
jgi:hypothetical protein